MKSCKDAKQLAKMSNTRKDVNRDKQERICLCKMEQMQDFRNKQVNERTLEQPLSALQVTKCNKCLTKPIIFLRTEQNNDMRRSSITLCANDRLEDTNNAPSRDESIGNAKAATDPTQVLVPKCGTQ